MKRLLKAYKDLIGIIFAEAPVMVILTFICTIVNGLLSPIGVYISQNVFDGGLSVAKGEMAFSDYTIFLVLFVIVAILPEIINGFIFNYVQPRSILIFRTTFKARMLEKLKTIKYEHFENSNSAEVIDKAYNRAENAARHLWPMYVYWRFGALIASIGILLYVFNIRWWLILTVLLHLLFETYL